MVVSQREGHSLMSLTIKHFPPCFRVGDGGNLLTVAGFNASVCNAKIQTAALTTIRKALSFLSDVAFQCFHCSVDHGFAQDLDIFCF